MGGNALKMLKTVRLDKEHYEYVSQGMVEILKQTFPKARIEVIPAYASKKSFGDLDILISGVTMDKLLKFATESLKTPQYYQNGGVLSIGVDVTALLKSYGWFQVDFITVPEEDFNFALNYFAYNDLGNLIGQTAHGIGLKFGHDGLWYKYIVDTQLVKEICITKDFATALDVLGYSYHEYLKGFSTLEDIFYYAVASPHFTTWNYQLENRNHVSRIRDKKRKTYMEFLEWMKDKKLPSERAPRDHGIRIAASKMRNVALEFMDATFEYFRVQRIKAKFNGELVGEITGLTGKELGGFITAYRGEDKVAFTAKVDSMDAESLKQDILQFFNQRSKECFSNV